MENINNNPVIIKIHGKTFLRTGTCNRCPDIHPAPCCDDCIHFAVIDGVNTCLIYDDRIKICPVCTEDVRRACKSCPKEVIDNKKPINHLVCVNFPDHPWLRVITDGTCSYKFNEIK